MRLRALFVALLAALSLDGCSAGGPLPVPLPAPGPEVAVQQQLRRWRWWAQHRGHRHASGGVTGTGNASWGSAGGASSSFPSSTDANPNGGTVTMSSDTWTQQGFTDVNMGAGYIIPSNGYVEIHVG